MRPTLRVFIIGFFATAVPYALMSYFFEYFDCNCIEDTASLLKILFSAIFFGLLMATFFVIVQNYKLKKAGYPILNNDMLKLKQVRFIEPNLSKNELIDLLKESEYFKKCKFKITPTSIIIKKRISWFSWGEKITISFNEKDNKIKIESKPTMPTTLIDYGINLLNVDNVVKIIKRVDAI